MSLVIDADIVKDLSFVSEKIDFINPYISVEAREMLKKFYIDNSSVKSYRLKMYFYRDPLMDFIMANKDFIIKNGATVWLNLEELAEAIIETYFYTYLQDLVINPTNLDIKRFVNTLYHYVGQFTVLREENNTTYMRHIENPAKEFAEEFVHKLDKEVISALLNAEIYYLLPNVRPRNVDVSLLSSTINNIEVITIERK